MIVTDEEDNDTDEKNDNEEDTDEEDCIWALFVNDDGEQNLNN